MPILETQKQRPGTPPGHHHACANAHSALGTRGPQTTGKDALLLQPGVSGLFREEAGEVGRSSPPSSYPLSFLHFLKTVSSLEPELDLGSIAMNTQQIKEKGGEWRPGGKTGRKELR